MKFAYLALLPILLAPEALLPLEYVASAQAGPQQRPPGNSGGGQKPGKPQPGRPGSGNPGHPGNPGGGSPGRPGDGNPGRPGTGNPGRPGTGNPGRPGGGNPGGPGIGNPGRPGIGNPGRPGQGGRPPVANKPYRPGSGRPPSFRPIRQPGFRYPSGHRYRRWTVRALLPAIFLGASYRFYDYAAVGVGPPPPGYYWVRYGPDLLLVQRGTRRITDVIYGAFYR